MGLLMAFSRSFPAGAWGRRATQIVDAKNYANSLYIPGTRYTLRYVPTLLDGCVRCAANGFIAVTAEIGFPTFTLTTVEPNPAGTYIQPTQEVTALIAMIQQQQRQQHQQRRR